MYENVNLFGFNGYDEIVIENISLWFHVKMVVYLEVLKEVFDEFAIKIRNAHK